jgi:hypothetical protein
VGAVQLVNPLQVGVLFMWFALIAGS